MLKEEFIARTGFHPSPLEWKCIEYRYFEADEESDDEFIENFNAGWLPMEGGTKMSEKDYEKLEERGGEKVLTDDEAKALVHRLLGFDTAKIEIVHEVARKEMHRDYYDVTRDVTFPREPRRNGYNCYVRFNVTTDFYAEPWEWELINCELFPYTI